MLNNNNQVKESRVVEFTVMFFMVIVLLGYALYEYNSFFDNMISNIQVSLSEVIIKIKQVRSTL